MFVHVLVFVNNRLEVLHVRKYAFQFCARVFSPNLVTCVVLVLTSLVLSLLFLLYLLTFNCPLLVELVLQSVSVFVRTVKQIVNCHENLPQIKILVGVLLVAALDFRLNLVFLMNSVLNFS